VAFSPNSKIVASGSGDKTIKLSDISVGKHGQKLEGHAKKVNTICFSPDRTVVASGSADKSVRLWEVATGMERHALQGHDGSIYAIAFSLDSRVVASGSGENVVILWDVATGGQRQRFEGHTGEISAIAFSLDGKMVASGSDDKTVKLWDAVTAKELQSYPTSKTVSRISFSDDGIRLETDTGNLDLGAAVSQHRTPVPEPQPDFHVMSCWIQYRGVDLVWLPHEYRAACHDESGSFLVIGQASGAVSFLSAR